MHEPAPGGERADAAQAALRGVVRADDGQEKTRVARRAPHGPFRLGVDPVKQSGTPPCPPPPRGTLRARQRRAAGWHPQPQIRALGRRRAPLGARLVGKRAHGAGEHAKRRGHREGAQRRRRTPRAVLYPARALEQRVRADRARHARRLPGLFHVRALRARNAIRHARVRRRSRRRTAARVRCVPAESRLAVPGGKVQSRTNVSTKVPGERGDTRPSPSRRRTCPRRTARTGSNPWRCAARSVPAGRGSHAGGRRRAEGTWKARRAVPVPRRR